MLWHREVLLIEEAHGSLLTLQEWWGRRGKKNFLEEEKLGLISKVNGMQTEEEKEQPFWQKEMNRRESECWREDARTLTVYWRVVGAVPEAAGGK